MIFCLVKVKAKYPVSKLISFISINFIYEAQRADNSSFMVANSVTAIHAKDGSEMYLFSNCVDY